MSESEQVADEWGAIVNMTQRATARDTMTMTTRWRPSALVESLQDEFEHFFWPFGFGRPSLRERLLRGTRTSHADIYEQYGDLIVSAELPGIPKEAISLTLQHGDLVIQGETRPADVGQEEGYYWRERRYRRYYRRVQLPFEAQPEQITATYADGVLEVRIANPAGQLAVTQSIPVQ